MRVQFLPFIFLIGVIQSHLLFGQQAADYHNQNSLIQKSAIREPATGKVVRGKKEGEFTYKNQLGEIVKVETYKNDKLLSTKRFAPKAYFYDANHKLIELRRYDSDGYLTTSSPSDNMASFGPKDCIEKYLYDTNGNLIETQFYSGLNQIMEDEYSPSFIVNEYNKDSKLIKESFLNSKRKLMEDIMGLAFTTFDYDKAGNNLRIQYHKSDGSLSDANYGSSTTLLTYDHNNNLIESRLLAPDGSLAPLDMAGAPIERMKYNNKKQKIYESGWASETELLGVYKYSYLDNGKLNKKEFYEAEDTLSVSFVTEYVYDSSGHVISKNESEVKSSRQRTVKAGVTITIKGWTWTLEPSIFFDMESTGNLEFQFEINNEGVVINYGISKQSAGTEMLDYCRNILNQLKLKKTGESETSQIGTIAFTKL